MNSGDGDNRRHGRIFRRAGPAGQRRSPTGSRRRLDAICSRASRRGSTGQSPTSSASTAIQIGLPGCPFLAQSRVASRWTVDSRRARGRSCADPHWLPFPGELARPHRAAACARVHERSASAPARGLPRHSRRRPDRHFGIQSVQPVRRQALLRPRAVAAVERQLHRAVPAEGLARAARLRGDRAAASTATCRRSRTRNGARGSAFSRRPATAGGRSAAAFTTCARRRRCSACASSRRRGNAAQERPRDRARGRRASGIERVDVDGARSRAACRHDLHRWRMQGQSRARRLGRAARLRRPREGALRRRGRDHQQPDGADRRHSRARIADARLRRRRSTPIRST